MANADRTTPDLSGASCDRRWKIPEERNRLTKKQYGELFLRQDGRCPCCGQRIEIKGGQDIEIIDEHVKPLSMGGSNDLSNRELWCKPCAKIKTSGEAPIRSKSNRVREKFIGAPKRKTAPIPGSRNTKFKKTFSYGVVLRENN